jgi:GT2 family glycosyltransferase
MPNVPYSEKSSGPTPAEPLPGRLPVRFAIVIPTHNRRDSLLHVLDEVSAQCRAIGVNPRLVVVADGCEDGTTTAVRSRFPEAMLVMGDGDWWWTRSINQGCRAALRDGAQAVLLLNDDITLAADYVSRLLRAAGEHPDAIIGSLNLTADGRIFFSGALDFHWWSGRLLRYHNFLAPGGRYLGGTRPSVVLPGRGMWVPAAAFVRNGFFCERFLVQYKADYDFVLRAHKRGLRCLTCWDAVVEVALDSCGRGASFGRGGLGAYLRAWFSSYSRNGLLPNLCYYLRHTPIWAWPLLPLIGARVAGRHLFRFLKERRPEA